MSAAIQTSRDEQVRSGQIMAVGRLAASIAHDLRNPLAAVVGGSEMLAEFDLPPDQITADCCPRPQGCPPHGAAAGGNRTGRRAQERPTGKQCLVGDLVSSAVDVARDQGEAQGVEIRQLIEGEVYGAM